MKTLDNKTLLITGGTGSFGSTLVSKLISSKIDQIKIFSRDEKKQEDMRNFYENKKLKFIIGDVRDEVIDSEIIICRAFKKLDQIIQVSREIAQKPHKLMILKGQNAQEEIKNSFKTKKYPYKLESSMTNKDSKIILMEINK